MEKLISKKNAQFDRIEGDTIILFDYHGQGAKILKKVEIISKEGKRNYEIKRTSKWNYLFN